MVKGLYGSWEAAVGQWYGSDEVQDLRREARDLKKAVAEQAVELHLL